MLYHDNDKIYCASNKEQQKMTDKYRKTDTPTRYNRLWDIQRTPEQIQRMVNAYNVWMSFFPKMEHQSSASIFLREKSWCSYVDARDLLPDGSTYAALIADRVRESAEQ